MTRTVKTAPSPVRDGGAGRLAMTTEDSTPEREKDVSEAQPEQPEGLVSATVRPSEVERLDVRRKENLVHLRVGGSVAVHLLVSPSDARRLVDEFQDVLDDV